VEPVLLLSASWYGRASLSIKFGLLFGVFLGALVLERYVHGAADLSLALVWITGLIALESARLSDWSPWRLAVGSLLLVYPSAVHYPGIMAQAGVAIYLFGHTFRYPGVCLYPLALW
jgi:hypothetical protein